VDDIQLSADTTSCLLRRWIAGISSVLRPQSTWAEGTFKKKKEKKGEKKDQIQGFHVNQVFTILLFQFVSKGNAHLLHSRNLKLPYPDFW